jgi:hypothetical protein
LSGEGKKEAVTKAQETLKIQSFMSDVFSKCGKGSLIYFETGKESLFNLPTTCDKSGKLVDMSSTAKCTIAVEMEDEFYLDSNLYISIC